MTDHHMSRRALIAAATAVPFAYALGGVAAPAAAAEALPAPAAHWAFDEGTGTSATDTSGNPGRPPPSRTRSRPTRSPSWRSTSPADPTSHVIRAARSDHLTVGPEVPSTDAQWARIEPLLPDRTVTCSTSPTIATEQRASPFTAAHPSSACPAAGSVRPGSSHGAAGCG